MIDPNQNLQTHDTLGRMFTTPQGGGPVPGMINMVVGEPKAGGFMVTIQKDEQDIGFDLDDDNDPRPALQAITAAMTPYDADIAYFRWYKCHICDDNFDNFVSKVKAALSM